MRRWELDLSGLALYLITAAFVVAILYLLWWLVRL